MTEYSPGPRSGTRDNGLRCGGYVAIGDLDPRVADSLLETLRSEGIAAYAAPTPAARGGYLELRLPAKHTDRVYADTTKSERAKALYEAEQADAELVPADPTAAAPDPEPMSQPEPVDPQAPVAEPPPLDVDAAWQGLLGSLLAPTPPPTWPSREDVAAGSPPVTFDADRVAVGAAPYEELDDDHYVPPQPPPLPKLRTSTVGSLLTIAFGIVVLVTGFGGGDFSWLAIAAIIGGAIALIWNVKDGPPADADGDDGAVV